MNFNGVTKTVDLPYFNVITESDKRGNKVIRRLKCEDDDDVVAKAERSVVEKLLRKARSWWGSSSKTEVRRHDEDVVKTRRGCHENRCGCREDSMWMS